jgi:hypothetical protein
MIHAHSRITQITICILFVFLIAQSFSPQRAVKGATFGEGAFGAAIALDASADTAKANNQLAFFI